MKSTEPMIKIKLSEYNNLLKCRCQIEKLRKSQKKYAENHKEECYVRTKQWYRNKKEQQQ